jgi:hypothetical protein
MLIASQLVAKERNWREGGRGREHRRGDIISFESVIFKI